MQTFEDRQHYTQSADDVLAKYTDPAFLSRKYSELGREDIQVLEHVVDADKSLVRMAYSDTLDIPLPDFARKFMPERSQIEQTARWDLTARKGELVVEAKGSPVTLNASLNLTDEGTGCSLWVSWQV